MVIHQVFKNEKNLDIETLFILPYSDSIKLTKIIAEFTL
jgi:hypothetical protein